MHKQACKSTNKNVSKKIGSKALKGLLFITLVAVFFFETRRQAIERREDSNDWLLMELPKAEQVLGNQLVKNFSEAKKILSKLYGEENVSFYCGCRYKKNLIDHQSCAYQALFPSNRSFYLEWEHIVPANRLGSHLKAWRTGHSKCVDRHGRAFRGRACAHRVDAEFRRMEADLYNLVPAIGEVNNFRGAKSFGIVSDRQNLFGACHFYEQNHIIEPRPEVRGMIARAYLYMHENYPGVPLLKRSESKIFKSWHKEYPVTRKEYRHAIRILHIQGNKNNYILKNEAV